MKVATLTHEECLQRKLRNKLANEFLGTIFLLLTINFSANTASHYATFLVPVTVFVLASIHAPISKGLFNPAVTFRGYLCDKFNNTLYEDNYYQSYYVWEMLGGFAGCILAHFLGLNIAHMEPSDSISRWIAFLMEAAFTCILNLVVAEQFIVKYHPEINLPAAATVYCAICSVGMKSGACMNPAVGVPLVLVRVWLTGTGDWTLVFLYILGPMCGAYLAYLIHERYVRPIAPPKEVDKPKISKELLV